MIPVSSYAHTNIKGPKITETSRVIMIQSFFFISNTGEIVIEKHWRGVTSRSVCEFFWDEVNKYDNKEEMPPIIATSKYYLISIYRSNSFLLATTTGETQPLVVIEFLHRVFEIFEEYFGAVDEVTIKDNFSTVYQLLEEMMDFGYPLTTEPNALKAMIQPPTAISRLTNVTLGGSNISDILPDGTISNMPWRKTDVSYTQNEIYLDIIEEIDAIVDRNGLIVTSEVSGIIVGNSRLSGVPDLALSFVNPDVIDDCSFHPCVRYTRFERDRIISFVPPDGNFELMRYRVSTPGHVSAPCYCQPTMSYDAANNQGSMMVMLGTKITHSLIFANRSSSLLVEDVEVIIPFSRAVRTANFKVSVGSVLFDEASKVARWEVGKLQAERFPQLTATILYQPNSKGKDEAPTLQMQWKVASATVSGLSVAALQLTNERYKPYKGVRTVAKGGKFQIRCV